MLPRWNSSLRDINLFLEALDNILPMFKRKKQKGRPPKHSPRKYLEIVIAKEFKKASTRDAEHDFSRKICRTRVDHSVVNYWERKFDKNFIVGIIHSIGLLLTTLLPYSFSFIDSTKFTSWVKNEIEFHVLMRIGNGFLYPVNVFFGTVSPKIAVKQTLIKGKGRLLGDPWYDDNKAFREMFHSGYKPIIKPNRNRFRGFWRKVARNKFQDDKQKKRPFYRQRGRGESIFGSLTNEFGDRLKTSRDESTITRIGARIIAQMTKIYMRTTNFLLSMTSLPNFMIYLMNN